MQSTRCRRRSSQGRQAEWRAGARVPEHFAVINNGVGGLEAITRLMDSPASGSCSACLRWREGRRRWGRWAGCWSWEAPFSVQFSERANNSRSPCSVVWGGMNLFSRWHRDYRLLLYFPYNCNCICERKQNYFQFYICMYIITTTVILHLQRAIFETFDLWDIRGERIVFWWPNTNTNIIRLFNNDRIQIRILFDLKKVTEYEYEYYSDWKKQPNTNTNIIRFEKMDRIRIRILFGLKKSPEYEYEY